MPVGTGNIKLSDVTTEVYGDTNPGRSLLGCFAVAAGTFNPSYVGSKDRLSNFKGYDKRVYDQQGNVYGAIRIGDQVWMDSNLKTSIFLNGVSIIGVAGDSDWRNSTSPAWSDYGNNGNILSSKLYNGYAVISTNKLAPLGWHIPSLSEWTTLANYIGYATGGDKLKKIGTEYWNGQNLGATNEFGFSAVPGGSRLSTDGAFVDLGYYARWWASDGPNSNQRYYVDIYHNSSGFLNQLYGDYLRAGSNVRCIRNKYIELQFISEIKTYNSVTYTNNADGGQDGSIIERGIEINGGDENNSYGNGVLSLTLGDLLPSTTYSLRAWATSTVYGTLFTSYHDFTTNPSITFNSQGNYIVFTGSGSYFFTGIIANAYSAYTITNMGFLIKPASGAELTLSTTEEIIPATLSSGTLYSDSEYQVDISAAEFYYVRAFITNGYETIYSPQEITQVVEIL